MDGYISSSDAVRTSREASRQLEPQRSLKKKKSLSRLFSFPSRKSSRSRPASPDANEDIVPATPQLPKSFTPKALKSPYLSSQFGLGRAIGPHTTPELSTPRPSTSRWEKQVPDGADQHLRRSFRQFSCPSSGQTHDALGESSKHAHGRGAETRAAPGKLQESRVLAKTGLRTPPVYATASRDQRFPLELRRSRSHPSLPLSRALSTSGAERATGKRRREGTTPPSPKKQEMPMNSHRQRQTPLDDIRSSFRSGNTTSSPGDSASTKRSSVVTNQTSVTEVTTETYSRPSSKGGPRAEKAVDRHPGHEAGSKTEPGRETRVGDEDEFSRSEKIAEAMNQSINSTLQAPCSPVSPSYGLNVPRIAPRSERSQQQDDVYKPPRLQSPTSLRDQYGFLKANHYVAASEYDLWNAGYRSVQERRLRKWMALMREHHLAFHEPSRFPARSAKTERFILKGIPAIWRGAAWFHYAGGQQYLDSQPHLYADLVCRSENDLGDADRDAIERDLHRTFPDNIHFKSPGASPDTDRPILRSLRRVLRAFAVHSPKIGYCQSLNFLAGLLLLFLPEEKTFILLHIITRSYLPGTHSLNLEGANIDLWVLMQALRTTLPDVWSNVASPSSTLTPSTSITRSPLVDHPTPPANGNGRHKPSPTLSSSLPPISLCTTSWFMSLFVGNLPIESTLRIWDSLFYHGPQTIFRAALAVFRLGEKRILSAACPPSNTSATSGSAYSRRQLQQQRQQTFHDHDPVELFQVVQSLPRSLLDAGTLMKVIARRDGVTADWVERKRFEGRKAVIDPESPSSPYESFASSLPRRDLSNLGNPGDAITLAKEPAPRKSLRRRHSLWQTQAREQEIHKQA